MVKLDLVFYDRFPLCLVHRVAFIRDMVFNNSLARLVLSTVLLFRVGLLTVILLSGSENLILPFVYALFLTFR